jgi:DNA-binding beta-propeller fold protein YncE
MTVIDRIAVADPTSLAMGPNLDFLAVSNQSADTVSFIDINPNSSTFHQVVKNTVVGKGPRGLAWDPLNEDLLVCNEIDDTISIISAFSLEVRREVGAQLNEPFEVCIFPRQVGFAFNRNVYFAYILNRSGTVAIFESGPNGVNGWGFDDVIGVAPFIFQNPKTIRPDPINLQIAAWVVHEGPIDIDSGQPGTPGEGAVSLLWVESALAGQIPLGTNLQNPTVRSMELGIQVSVGEDRLSGVPVDIAFDNLRNLGGLPNYFTTFTSGAPSPQNSKGLVRAAPAIRSVSASRFAFVAVPNASGGSGIVDVLETGAAGVPQIDTNPYVAGVQGVLAPNVSVVADYWRQ